MKARVILDAGPLVAAINRRDRYHEWATEKFAQIEPPFLTCESAITEAWHRVRDIHGGPQTLMQFIARGAIKLDFSLGTEFQSVASLIDRFMNVPMSLADGCLVRMAELNPGSPIMTLDNDFRIYRINGRHVVPTIMPPEIRKAGSH